jgi:hypothetical protein
VPDTSERDDAWIGEQQKRRGISGFLAIPGELEKSRNGEWTLFAQRMHRIGTIWGLHDADFGTTRPAEDESHSISCSLTLRRLRLRALRSM